MKTNNKTPLQHKVNLSSRLQKIHTMALATNESNSLGYDHIWDCCCDHGLLGFSLLSTHRNQHINEYVKTHEVNKNKAAASPFIHFVDIVPQLMINIEKKLERFFSDNDIYEDENPASVGHSYATDDAEKIQDIKAAQNAQWKTHCLDVAKLPLAQYSGKQLVIIAGVGGDLMIEFINAICKQYHKLAIDFLLCPVHHQYALRQQLIDLDCSLIAETLIEDNQRFYEIIHVSTSQEIAEKTRNKTVSAVGENIWQTKSVEQTKIAEKYLAKTLKHYLRIKAGYEQRKPSQEQQKLLDEIQHIIDAYKQVLLQGAFS